MLVKAVRTGYYNNARQKEGSVFKLIEKKILVDVEKKENGKVVKKKAEKVIPVEDQFSEMWMEKLEESDVPAAVVAKAKAKAKEAKKFNEEDLERAQEANQASSKPEPSKDVI